MPRIPCAQPDDSPRCDMRLPAAALAYRRQYALTGPNPLRSLNVTAWLYRDPRGAEGIQVNPNTTIQELIQRFGKADTPDAEVGFHSEMMAAEWFRRRPDFQVLQIFSERLPCRYMCEPMLRFYFPGVPWYYYFARQSWTGTGGQKAAAVLRQAYELR